MSKAEMSSCPSFSSCLAPWFGRFIQEKRGLGFRYIAEVVSLRQLDRLLQKEGWQAEELPRSMLESWVKPQPHNSPNSLSRKRATARQLALFLAKNNIPTYIFPSREGQTVHFNYVPRIFSRSEIRKLLTAADSLAIPFDGHVPLRCRVIPEVFRLLYGCGLRVGEVTRLQVRDVDLAEGVLTVREAKGNSERLVPVAPSLKERLNRYAGILGNRPREAPFFPSSHGGFYRSRSIYPIFRKLLRQVGIPHGGRGQGPRLHDIRHTFAVHRLIDWYREGADINAKLPVLAAYLGHRHLTGTQHYLHLTAELFPDITINMESTVGHVIPHRSKL